MQKLAHKKKIYLSADVFGEVSNVHYNLGIGQQWEAISSVVDYISPMIYPSHYQSGFRNISIPDAAPYDTIVKAIESAILRNKDLASPASIRPWIQGFTAKWVSGYIDYDKKALDSQIQALKDQGIYEYMIWHPSSRYEHFFKD